MSNSLKLGALAAVVVSSIAEAQIPATRQIGSVTATTSEAFGVNVFVRHLKDGVLVNDIANRRLLLFDTTLSKFTVVADSTPATANAYSGRNGGLIAYKADSTLFVDAASMSMLVIDPAGKVQRVMSVPRSQDAMVLGNSMLGAPAFDGAGKLVYRGMPRPMFRQERVAAGAGGGAPAFSPPDIPDTSAVLRIDLATRQVDTVAWLKGPKIKFDIQRDDNGRVNISSQVNPLPVVDDFGVMSDGSIAVVRGRDYHVDFIRPDGKRESAAKIPFEWRRLTDEDKVAFLDSVKAARQRMANAPMPQIAGAPAGAGAAAGGGAAGGGRPGGDAGRPGEVRIMIGGDGPGGGAPPGGGGMMGNRELSFVPAAELPDYQPVFFAGAVRADNDGHLWIRTTPTKALPGGPVYDVVNSKGELVDRVQVPKDRTIAGFGTDGIVYLIARDGTTTKLERARMK
ncbi:MAG TPA: hypothetical protein VFT29_09730 [Gemmatimonadaceae bacterium]|nr:hypothetical protein [Gemmatimonadaceae bacterium]